MKIEPYETNEERDRIISEQNPVAHIVHHTNVDGSKELHIHDRAPEVSDREKIAALEVRIAALEKL